jgi:molybdopterin-guanine dinucleotide biosynthesis protein A
MAAPDRRKVGALAAEDSFSAIILAGGRSVRFGRDKCAEIAVGRPLLQHVVDAVSPVASEIIIVRAPGMSPPPVQSATPLRHAEDVREGGALVGLYSGLLVASQPVAVALGCDMPLLSRPLLRYLRSLMSRDVDVVMPLWEGKEEPLHAFYRRTCLSAIEKALDEGKRRIVDFLPGVRVRYVSHDKLRPLDAEGRSFWNVNHPSDLSRILPLLEGETPPKWR